MVGMSFVDVADVGDLDVQHELTTNMDNFGRRGDDAGAMFHILVIGQGIEYVRYVVWKKNTVFFLMFIPVDM